LKSNRKYLEFERNRTDEYKALEANHTCLRCSEVNYLYNIYLYVTQESGYTEN